MATEVKLKLALVGGRVVSQEIDGVTHSMGNMRSASVSTNASFGDLGAQALALTRTLGGLAAMQKAVTAAGDYAGLSSRMALLTGSLDGAAAAMQKVTEIAQRQGANLQAVGDSYAKIGQAMVAMGGTSADTARMVETVAGALRLGNASTAEAASAMRQFGQAMAKGKLNGDEFVSLMENAPYLMDAVAASLGKTKGDLFAMAEAGQLTAQVFGDAVLGSFDSVTAKASTLAPTIGQAVERITTAFTVAAAESKNVGLATSTAFAAMGFAADHAAQILGVLTTGAMVALANQAMTVTSAIGAKVTATLADRAAMVANLQSTVASTEAKAIYTGMVLRETQATLAHASGLGASVVAQNAAIAATRAHTAATLAQTEAQVALRAATSLGARALGLLGGPIGAITAVLGLGLTAWSLWGSSAKAAEEKAAAAVEQSDAQIISVIKNQILQIQRRNALAGAKISVNGFDLNSPAAERMGAIQLELNALEKQNGLSAEQYLTQKNKLLARQGALQQVLIQQERDSAPARAAAAVKAHTEAMAKYAPVVDKATAAIEAERKALGAAFTAEDEAKIKAYFATRKTGVATVGAAAKEAATSQKLLNDLNLEAMGFKPDFAAQWIALSKVQDGTQGLTTAQAELLSQQPLMKDAAMAEKALAEARIKSWTDLAKLTEKAQDETAQIKEKTAEIGLSKSAIDELRASTIDLSAAELERKAYRSYEKTLNQEDYDSTMALARAQKEKAAALRAQGVAEGADELTKENKIAAEESGKYWQDALMRAFESGKGFFESLWDTIKNTLKTQVLKVMVSGVVGGFSGAASASGGGEAGGGGNLLGTAANLSSMFDKLSGGANVASALGVKLASLAGKMGSQVTASFAGGMLSTGSMANAAAAAQAGGASMAGLIAGSVANGLAGYGVSKFISGGYQVNSSINKIGAIASMIPGVGPIAGVVSGLVNRAFGRKAPEITAQGTRGTFGASGDFSGVNYASYQQKGGWFRSDKNWTDTSAIDPATVTAWSSAFAGVKTSVAEMATSLGLSTAKITSYSKSIDIAAGTTEEQITAMFTRMADDMASAVAPSIAKMAKTGETSSVTLQRLSSSLSVANSWLAMLRTNLFDVSLAGADAASSLADAFGSLDNLAASSKAFYDLFYTDAEKVATSVTDLSKAMALVGVVAPANKRAFKDVVSGLDLTTASGRNTYAVLLALAPEFAATTATIDQLATDTAAKLIKTFTANGALTPALNTAALKIGNVASGAGTMTTAMTTINKVMGDASSGTITLGGDITTLGTGMTASQQSARLLSKQIVSLQTSADKTRIDFGKLGIALLGVDPASVSTDMASVNRYLQSINVLPVGTSVSAVSKYLAGVNALPVGTSVAAANAYLAGVAAMPVGTSIARANAYLSGVKAVPVGTSITAVNDYLAGVESLPVGTSIADANAYLTGVKALPVGATIASVNAYLAGVKAVPVGTSVAAVNAYLAGVLPVPVGTSIATANAYLAGVKALPVGTSVAQANAYLAGVKALPVGVTIADVNKYLTAVKALPVGTSIASVNAYLEAVETLPVGTSVADANKYLAGVKPLPVGTSIASVNTYLAAVSAVPVGTSVAAANAYLAGVKALPVGTSIADVNKYLAGVKALPVGTSIDAVNAALAGVNTETFVATIALVFENLAERIGSVIDSITAERVAVREAALQIIDPTVMTKVQIQRQISKINTTLPSATGVTSANAALAAKDKAYATALATSNKEYADVGKMQSTADARAALNATSVTKAKDSLIKLFNSSVGLREMTGGNIGALFDGTVKPGDRPRQGGWASADELAQTLSDRLNAYSAAQNKLAADTASNAAKIAKEQTQYNAALAKTVAAQTAVTAAEAAAKAATLKYVSSLQNFSVDAGKSVDKLTKLRVETVKYYETQQALADLMSTSAATLRTTVSDYRYNQLTPEDQVASLKSQFSRAYSLALASQGDGETLAGYGDRLNSLLGPLIDKLAETGRTSQIASYLAQAESVATLIEEAVPVNYQADSLELLGSIDSALAALDASSKSAEKIISDAVKAGSDRTADGLRAVIAAITGETVPAFATGGYHSGGIRLVGENGPELEVTGPSRILSNDQTLSLLSPRQGSDGGALAREVSRLTAVNERLEKRLEAIERNTRSGAVHSADSADTLRTLKNSGVQVWTDPAEPIQTVAA